MLFKDRDKAAAVTRQGEIPDRRGPEGGAPNYGSDLASIP